MNAIQFVRERLSELADEKTRISGTRFFKEEIILYGVKSKDVSKLAAQSFKMITDKSKDEIFAYCDELWRSFFFEEAAIACDWAYSLRKKYEPSDFGVFKNWVTNYITNWAACDTLCNHTIGTFVEMYPEYIKNLKNWCSSSNRWMKRAAAVTLVIPARKGLFLQDIQKIGRWIKSENS